ncbi:TPA: hypothetical protein L5732_006389 [Pseudomonas aeruginosa]|nr:hypothetical protein [Pseudomonas aeruginosa]
MRLAASAMKPRNTSSGVRLNSAQRLTNSAGTSSSSASVLSSMKRPFSPGMMPAGARKPSGHASLRQPIRSALKRGEPTGSTCSKMSSSKERRSDWSIYASKRYSGKSRSSLGQSARITTPTLPNSAGGVPAAFFSAARSALPANVGRRISWPWYSNTRTSPPFSVAMSIRRALKNATG